MISRHPDKGTLRIECGEKNIEVASLEVIKNDKPLTTTLKNIGFHLAPPVEVSLELNLVGLRADEAREEVERYLDRALLSHFSRAFIIHGVGGGILRKIVAEILSRHPRVKSYRSGAAGEGGIGVTIVEFDV